MENVKRSSIIKKCILCAIAVLVCGCSTTNYNVAADQVRPVFAGEVLVFEKTVPATVKYSVIGDFVSQEEWYGGTGQATDSAVKEAANKGANGLLVEETGHRVTAFSWASPYTEGKLLWIDNYDVALAQQGKE